MNHYVTYLSNDMPSHQSHQSHQSHSEHRMNSSKSGNPCTDVLTDLEYLTHMIPHHQVAIDMSHMLQPNTQNPRMLHLCRDIIRKQGYEIWEMTMVKQNISETIFAPMEGTIDDYTTSIEYYEPLLSSAQGEACNPMFFKPDDHMKHMVGNDVTDKTYLEHMIPHHQVAIDMSRRLLLHTNHPYLMEFCHSLIMSQQGEIYNMKSMLQNTYNYSSALV